MERWGRSEEGPKSCKTQKPHVPCAQFAQHSLSSPFPARFEISSTQLLGLGRGNNVCLFFLPLSLHILDAAWIGKKGFFFIRVDPRPESGATSTFGNHVSYGFPPSPISITKRVFFFLREIFELADEMERSGKKITLLDVGQPDFASPSHAIDATVRSLQRGDTKYISNAGCSPLPVIARPPPPPLLSVLTSCDTKSAHTTVILQAFLPCAWLLLNTCRRSSPRRASKPLPTTSWRPWAP